MSTVTNRKPITRGRLIYSLVAIVVSCFLLGASTMYLAMSL